MERAANSPSIEKPHVYRIIDRERYSLDLKTETEAIDLYKKNRWDSNYGKLSFSEIILISRIILANDTLLEGDRIKLCRALNLMANKAENKYNNSWKGTLRKIWSIIRNLLWNGHISLFEVDCKDPHVKFLSMPKWKAKCLTVSKLKDSKLPCFVGSDANFARLVVQRYATT